MLDSFSSAKTKQIARAIGQYLNQPVFDSHSRTIWHPASFWFFYQLELLERCWHKDLKSANRR